MAFSKGIFKIMADDKVHDTAAGGSPRIELLLVGMNGDLRGSRIPLDAQKKIWAGEVRLPSSTQSLDIWGDDNDDITGLSLSVGDPDGNVHSGQAQPRSDAMGAGGFDAGACNHARVRRHAELYGSPSYPCIRAEAV